jgi:very-short-patch-repair endonuclease
VAESIVWKWLRNSRYGFKFRREVPIGPYRVDFYCHEALLAIELDGEQHDSVSDLVRDEFLYSLGIYVHRIPNRQFFGLDEDAYRPYITEVIDLCESRSGRPARP